MSNNWNEIEISAEERGENIKTHEVHPDDFNTFSCYDEVSKKIENLLVSWVNSGEKEIKISVLSGKGSKAEAVYQCLPKGVKVTDINDFDFKLIKL